MSFNKEITTDIIQAFDGDLADAVTPFTATRSASTDDDWAINDDGNDSHSYTGRGVFGSYSSYETDGQVITTSDVKLICLQKELTDTPMIDDVINGRRVLSIQKDPADVVWVIQLRGV